MARSYKKTPISGWSPNKSNKIFKKNEHQAERTKVKRLLRTEQYDDLPDPKEYGNEWDSPRDGKLYLGNMKNNRHKTWAEYGRPDLKKDQSDHESYIKAMRK